MIGRIMRGDYAAAEDVVQEAFRRAWQFYPSFDPEIGNLHSWFNSIVFNSLRDIQREMRGQPSTSDKDISWEDVLTDVTQKKEDLPKFISEVKNKKHQQVLYLFFILGYTSTEISEIEEGITVSNVTTIINRFKEALKNG